MNPSALSCQGNKSIESMIRGVSMCTGSVTVLAVICMLAGCAAVQLDGFKKRAASGDYAWIADQAVNCEKASDRCGQLHLIKGDACFRLAKAGTLPDANYACAANELDKGLALRPSWKDASVHRQFQENLCESLRNVENLPVSDPSAQNVDRLVEAAEVLYRLAPESVPAVFYLEDARLKKIQPTLTDLNTARRIPACNRLKRSINRVLATMKTAETEDLPDWPRFAQNYQQLSYDLGLAIKEAQCQ